MACSYVLHRPGPADAAGNVATPFEPSQLLRPVEVAGERDVEDGGASISSGSRRLREFGGVIDRPREAGRMTQHAGGTIVVHEPFGVVMAARKG